MRWNAPSTSDVVGLPGSFHDRAAFSVIALTDMKLEVCSLEAFVSVCYRRPKFALALTWLAVEHGMLSSERIVDLGESRYRIAEFVIKPT